MTGTIELTLSYFFVQNEVDYFPKKQISKYSGIDFKMRLGKHLDSDHKRVPKSD